MTLRWALSLSCLLDPTKATPWVDVLGSLLQAQEAFFLDRVLPSRHSGGEGRPWAVHLLGRSHGTVRYVHLEA